MKNAICACLFLILMLPPSAMAETERTVESIKKDIVALATKFIGKGDPDFSKQKELDVLVKELLKANPQKPVSERLPKLYGAWHQVWGPYDYRRRNSRGIDPDTNVEKIWQVVMKNGYYYNVMPSKDSERINLLKGKYETVGKHPELLKVRFVEFPGQKGLPKGLNYWDLPDLAEKGKLPNKITIVNKFIVWLFFGGGYLREVYTDDTMRITYGANRRNDRSKEFIYIMTKEKE